MKNNKLHNIIIIIIFSFLLIGYTKKEQVQLESQSVKADYVDSNLEEEINKNENIEDDAEEEIDRGILIAHAGGEIYGINYTNSLEALNRSYEKCFKYIELDFQWTKDDEVVLIHDWQNSVELLFDIEPRVLTYKEFKSLPTLLDLTMLDLNDLINWLDEYPDTYIITDTKRDNIKLLEYIKENFPDYIDRFIPQIYSFKQYQPVNKLGYEDIILTLYILDNTDDEIFDFAQENKLYAVTIPHQRAYNWLTRRLKGAGIKVYAHTINSLVAYDKLKNVGVYGIYTDYFEMNNFPLD